jgi:hypothetical protein
VLDGDASRRNAFARPPRPRARLAPPRPALAFPLVDAHRALVIARSFITARLSSIISRSLASSRARGRARRRGFSEQSDQGSAAAFRRRRRRFRASIATSRGGDARDRAVATPSPRARDRSPPDVARRSDASIPDRTL